MSREAEFRAATARADAARAQLLHSLDRAKARVSPAALKLDAKDKVKSAASQAVAGAKAKAKERPFAVGAAGAAFLLYLGRRPLAALFRRLHVRLHDDHAQGSETDDG